MLTAREGLVGPGLVVSRARLASVAAKQSDDRMGLELFSTTRQD